MRKILYLFILFFLNFNILSEDIFNELNYNQMSAGPVKWIPEAGIYSDDIILTVICDYGKIYYLINSDFSKTEPVEYNKKIILNEIPGGIVDYNVTVIIVKQDGSLEFYSRKYRIDKTRKIEKKEITDEKEYINKSADYKKDSININFKFPINNYDISYNIREFIVPKDISSNISNKKTITLLKTNNQESLYLVSLNYMKNDKIYSEVLNYSFYQGIVYPPSFGSLYWGQIYKQGYKIQIKPDKPEDKIYYWINEWDKNDLITGPPDQNDKGKWIIYNEPIELLSKYGGQGITGIAAYSEGINGNISTITGPFYFKINGISNTIEQVFINENKDQNLEKKIYLNGKLYEKGDKTLLGNAEIKFENFNKDDRFYFTYSNNNSSGKSELLPCTESYNFKNNEASPSNFDIYLANGNKIASFFLYPQKMTLPILKNYNSNYIDLSGDVTIESYMPEYLVRYDYTLDENKSIEITKESPIFNGTLKIATENLKKTLIKVKFKSFDKDGKAIDESNYYYFNIDKEKPDKDVAIDGVDIKKDHNEKLAVRLIPPDDNFKVYYRLSPESDWLQYTSPIIFEPPLNGKYIVKIYTKSQDEVGNERENSLPFDIVFDTRGIFVDYDYKYNGNGTEKNPCNSLEKAVKLANIKNIKFIYLKSNEISISEPIEITSNIIIQPYNNSIRTKINLISKSVWRKTLIWFDVKNNGYLEFRNLDFNIVSGGTFANSLGCKIKIYNSNLNYKSNDEFNFVNNLNGKIGLNNISINMELPSSNFSFLKSNKGFNILKNISMNINSNNLKLFELNNSKLFELTNASINALINVSSIFADIKNSNTTFKNIIFLQKGNYKNAYLYNLLNAEIFLEESDFILDGIKPFEIKLFNQMNSNSKIIQSLFKVNNAVTVIGFTAFGGSIIYDRSMLEMSNVLDYIYNFRIENASLKFNSSVIRNDNCFNSINFSLKNSSYEGANNSIFTLDNQGRGFNFWITDSAELTSVNSIFYFNNTVKNNAFIYFNNNNYDLLRPVWFSNIISADTIILENLDKKDGNSTLLDFNEKNIYFNFTDEFDFKQNDFFIPVKESPLLQTGITEYNSPIQIPKYDFKGNLRTVSGYGIDIGAVQISGN